MPRKFGSSSSGTLASKEIYNTSTNNNTTTTSEEDEEVTLAVQSLQVSIQRQIYKKYEKRYKTTIPMKTKQKVHELLQHITYCLTGLRQHVQSLQAALNCLTQQVRPAILQQLSKVTSNNDNKNNDQDYVLQLFQHLFIQMLRIQDGIIFCVSGECRHEQDVQNYCSSNSSSISSSNKTKKKKMKYKSNLNSPSSLELSTRDGYTSLYSASAMYSGVSYDEYNASRIGLRARLLQQLQPLCCTGTKQGIIEDVWDRLGDTGTAAMENVLSSIESSMSEIKQDMTRFWKYDLVPQLKQALIMKAGNNSIASGSNSSTNITIHIQMQDKLEKLHVHSSQCSCRLERYGSDFQIQGGVLPTQWTTADQWWEQVMKVPEPSIIHNHHHPSETNKNAVTTTTTRTTTNHSSKRRRVIEDSSDDEEDDNKDDCSKKNKKAKQSTNNEPKKEDVSTNTTTTTKTTTVASGLMVRIENKSTKEDEAIASSTSLSVNAIKQQFGVDTTALEAARDGLEAEEAITARAAAKIDFAPVDNNTWNITNNNRENALDDDNNDDDDESRIALIIKEDEQRVKRRTRVLRKEMSRLPIDYYAIWDARENLREATMRAGNSLLWSKPLTNSSRDQHHDDSLFSKSKMLHRAVQYFVDAKVLVIDQQNLNEEMIRKNNQQQQQQRQAGSINGKNTSHQGMFQSAKFYQRNLLLFQAQAITNAGIANVELGREMHSHKNQFKVEKEKILIEAIKVLEDALDITNGLVTRCQDDQADEECALNETIVDLLKAKQLESLALRWKASALWYMYKRKDAFNTFNDAANVLKESPLMTTYEGMQEDEIQEAVLNCQVECYYAWTGFADLAYGSLERADVSMIRRSPQQYEGIVGFFSQAMKKASELSKAMEERLEPITFATICDQNDVIPANDLTQSMKETLEWWKTKQTCASKTIEPANNNQGTQILPRNDVLPDGPLPSLPTKRFTLDEGARQRRQKRNNLGGGAGFSNIGPSHNTSEANTVSNTKPIEYNKWGDDLLPQTVDENGRRVPKLEYPSIAPEMPPEIKAMLEQYRRAKQNQQLQQ